MNNVMSLKSIALVLYCYFVIPIQATESLGAKGSGTANVLQEHQRSPLWDKVAVCNQEIDKWEKLDIYRTICDQLGATENGKIPKKSSEIVRIATYNVHFWFRLWWDWNSSSRDNVFFNWMIDVIKNVNADVMILQEVGSGNWKQKDLDNTLKKLGYLYKRCCNTGYVENCLISKFPFQNNAEAVMFKSNPKKPAEQRCFVNGKVKLPNGQVVSVYGTHLELRDVQMNGKIVDADRVRIAQLQELFDYISMHDKNENVVIGADFNAVLTQDLNNKIGSHVMRDLYQKDHDLYYLGKGLKPKKIGAQALDYAQNKGYLDSFARGRFFAPWFTVWTGARIDFLLLKPSWNLPLKGSYVYYTWASDHIPVIMDINVKKK